MHRHLFLIFGLSLSLAAAAAPPQGLDALAAYAGSWKTEIHHLDTAFSHKGEDLFTLRNDCWRSAGYYVCDQLVGGESKSLLVFTYDPATHAYSSYPIPAGVTGPVHPGTLLIQGAVWTFPWDVTEQGKTTHFRVLNTWSSPDSIEFRQEFSRDGKQWVLMAEGHETRLKP
jgi:hypothetical protein